MTLVPSQPSQRTTTRIARGRLVALALIAIIAVGAAGCREKLDPIPSAPGAPCSTEQVDFCTPSLQSLLSICTNCHSTSKVGPERNEAPAGVNWDDYDSVKDKAELAALYVRIGFMPPRSFEGTRPNDDQICAIQRWWALGAQPCGTFSNLDAGVSTDASP